MDPDTQPTPPPIQQRFDRAEAQVRHRRINLRPFLPGIIAIVVVLGIAGWLRYRPLRVDGIIAPPSDLRAGQDPANATIVSYRHGAEVFYRLRLRNAGRVPLTVQSLPIETRMSLLDIKEVRLATSGGSEDVAFEPFRLGPGDTRIVYIVGRFANCERFPGGGGTKIVAQRARYEALGRVREVTLELDIPLTVRSPGKGTGQRPGCPVDPGPKLSLP